MTKLLSTAVLLASMALVTNASAATVMFGTFNLNVSPDLCREVLERLLSATMAAVPLLSRKQLRPRTSSSMRVNIRH